jgi:hypothetical protein
MAHRARLDGPHPGMGDGPYVAQGSGEPVGGDSVGISRNAHQQPYIKASAASKAVDQHAAERDWQWAPQARARPSRGHLPQIGRRYATRRRTNVRDHFFWPTSWGHGTPASHSQVSSFARCRRWIGGPRPTPLRQLDGASRLRGLRAASMDRPQRFEGGWRNRRIESPRSAPELRGMRLAPSSRAARAWRQDAQ